MFGLGLIEILIVLILLSWVLRGWISRRWPNLGKFFTFLLWFVFIGVIAFDLIAWLGKN